MSTGIVFEVREFSLFDGPGMRTTVFMKGCPLRCAWCHNPEGISPKIQLLVNEHQCRHCGACKTVCQKTVCDACGKCVTVCVNACRRIAGKIWTDDELTRELLRHADVFAEFGGGVTFSGGEPLLQPDFLADVLDRLHAEKIHCAIETSGFATPEIYQKIVGKLDLVFQDIKHPDPDEHRKFTSRSNEPILENLRWLKTQLIPFIIRVPLIPGVNTAPEIQARIAELVKNAPSLLRVELLPYHKTAGAKYHLVGQTYQPPFPENEPVVPCTAPYEDLGVPVRVM